MDIDNRQADYRLLLPENVELQMEVAGLGSRIAAGVLDYGLLVLGIVASITTMARFRVHLRDLDSNLRSVPFLDTPYFPESMMALLYLSVFAAWWGYFVLFEWIWNGQTPGKRLFGLRVVSSDGQGLSRLASVTRNVCRVVDGLMLLGIVVMLIDRHSRRLGDIAAGTLVVRIAHQHSPLAIEALPAGGIPAHRTMHPAAASMTPPQYALLRDYFNRAAALSPADANVLASKLAESFTALLHLQGRECDPKQLLADLVYSYERYHFAELPSGGIHEA